MRNTIHRPSVWMGYGWRHRIFKGRSLTSATIPDRRRARVRSITSHVIEPSRCPTMVVSVRAPGVQSKALGGREALHRQPRYQEREMQVVFTKKEPPQWLLDMWKE